MSSPHDHDPANAPDGTRSFAGRPKTINSHLETRFQQLASAASTDAGEATPTQLQLPLPEKYVFRRVLGRGGMGEVLHVHDTELRREVALKYMRRQMAHSPVACRRFLEEARILAQLDHPNVVRVYERGEIEGRPYFAMAYLSGATLADRRDEFRTSASRAVAVVLEVAAGVQHAHDHGVYHRDLKGSNVVFDGGRPVVTDFGCARWDEGEMSTQGSALLGTPSHMAPEVWEHGSKEHDARADLWSLGVMLYQLLAGELPFGVDPRTPAGRKKLLTEDPAPITACAGVVPGVDERLEGIVRKALAKNPDDRYPTVAEFAAGLEEWLASRPVQPLPTPVAHVRLPKPSRRWAWWTGVVAALLVGGTAIALAIWPKGAARPTLAQRMPNVGDWVTFIGPTGLPTEEVGPVDGFVGTVTTGDGGRCELGTAKLYLHELADEALPFPVRLEADMALTTPDSQTFAGIYALRKEHRYESGKPVQVAFVNCFGMGDRNPNNRLVAVDNTAVASPAKLAPFDGTLDADTNTSFLPLVRGLQRVTPPDPIDPTGGPGPVHHLAIDVDARGCQAHRDGKPCGQLQFKKSPLDALLDLDGLTPNRPSLGSGYGLFVINGGAAFTNVRLTRRPDPD